MITIDTDDGPQIYVEIIYANNEYRSTHIRYVSMYHMHFIVNIDNDVCICRDIPRRELYTNLIQPVQSIMTRGWSIMSNALRVGVVSESERTTILTSFSSFLRAITERAHWNLILETEFADYGNEEGARDDAEEE